MEFQHIQILNVALRFGEHTIPVGRLATKKGQTYFEYDSDFIRSGVQISPYKLPLQEGLIQNSDSTFDGLFGVFNDSLPDGWGKLLLDRSVRAQGISQEGLTPLDRLSFVGKNGMGALIYTPEQHFEEPETIKIDLQAVADEIVLVIQGTASEVIEKLRAFGGSSAGARPKIVVGYNRENETLIAGTEFLPKEFEPWIIKFPSSTDPEDIAQIEQAYALMAKAANIEMTETRLFESNGKKFFGTLRFDRQHDNRLHMHTAAGLLHSSHRYPSLDYKDLMNLTWHLTQDHRQMEKVFRLCCYNVLAYNRDDHSKNFSFLMDEGGNWTFAPAYDLTFSSGPGGEQSTTVMGEGGSPNQAHLKKLATDFGLKKANLVIKEVEDAVHRWPDFALETGVSEESLKLISKHLSA